MESVFTVMGWCPDVRRVVSLRIPARTRQNAKRIGEQKGLRLVVALPETAGNPGREPSAALRGPRVRLA